MLFTTQWLNAIFSNNRGVASATIGIQEVTTDSRKKTTGSLFVPLIGDNFDGHDHVLQAINHGAVAIIWNQNKQLPDFLPIDFPIYLVEDTLEALQLLATQYRQEINPIVVGITGSNGKTTTKDLVAAIVKTTYKTHFTHGNFNNHIGLPLTILGMARETEVLILEMGMSDYKEIEQLSEIAIPDYAIITNIGESHIEFLGSREGITKAKLEIVCGMKENGLLIIDGDEALLESIDNHKNVVTCGFLSSNNVIIEQIEISHAKTTFSLLDASTYAIPLLGRHNAQNAAYAIILGQQLKISNEDIKKGLLSLELTGMRFELLKGTNDVSIVNDAYNASPTSMKAAIDVIKQMKGFKEKVLVLGDIFELGEQSEALHRSVADVIEPPITAVFTYGNIALNISAAVREKQVNIVCNHFGSKEALLNKLEQYCTTDTLILFKASRGMQFEKLVEAMQEGSK